MEFKLLCEECGNPMVAVAGRHVCLHDYAADLLVNESSHHISAWSTSLILLTSNNPCKPSFRIPCITPKRINTLNLVLITTDFSDLRVDLGFSTKKNYNDINNVEIVVSVPIDSFVTALGIEAE